MTKSEAYDFINDWFERQRTIAEEHMIKVNGELSERDKGKFEVMAIMQKMLNELNEKISSSEENRA